jgi:uncharacterized SAM-dependent methyltransferase
VDLDLARAYVELGSGQSSKGLALLAAAAAECRKFGYLPQAFYAEAQLAALRRDTAAAARVTNEAAGAGIKVY